MADDKKLLLDLRAARAEYDRLCAGRTVELTAENPPVMTGAQIAAMKHLMAAEQAWKHRHD